MNNKPICKIDSESNKYWLLNGKLHREDGPAVEYANGDKAWYLNGKRHREDGPAVEYANGTKHWFLNNKLHREDGPAVEYTDGAKHWYLNGKKYYYREWLTLIPNPLKYLWINFNEQQTNL